MAEKIAVIGLGQFGMAVAKKLSEKGAEVLAIDMDEDRVELVKDDVAYAVALDSTDIKALKMQNITDMDAVMLAIGENIEGLLLTTVLLLELNVKRIIARAMSDQQRMILEKIGVKEILSAEEEAANRVAEILLNPYVNTFLELPDEYQIAEVRAPRRVVKKTIGDIDLKENYNLTLIAIKRMYEDFSEGRRNYTEHLLLSISDNTVVQSYDSMYVIGKVLDIERFLDINS
jgi:trk system potassium uptake protein TrkA